MMCLIVHLKTSQPNAASRPNILDCRINTQIWHTLQLLNNTHSLLSHVAALQDLIPLSNRLAIQYLRVVQDLRFSLESFEKDDVCVSCCLSSTNTYQPI